MLLYVAFTYPYCERMAIFIYFIYCYFPDWVCPFSYLLLFDLFFFSLDTVIGTYKLLLENFLSFQNGIYGDVPFP